jgi:hypothetical protein
MSEAKMAQATDDTEDTLLSQKLKNMKEVNLDGLDASIFAAMMSGNEQYVRARLGAGDRKMSEAEALILLKTRQEAEEVINAEIIRQQEVLAAQEADEKEKEEEEFEAKNIRAWDSNFVLGTGQPEYACEPHFEGGCYYDADGGRYDPYGYRFKDGSYKDVDGNFYDKKKGTITAADTGKEIEVPKELRDEGIDGEKILQLTQERLKGESQGLNKDNFDPSQTNPPPKKGAGREHCKCRKPGSRYAVKVATEEEIRKTIDIEQEKQRQRMALRQQAVTAFSAGSTADVPFKALTQEEVAERLKSVKVKPPVAPAGGSLGSSGAKAAAPLWLADDAGGMWDGDGNYYDNKGGMWDTDGGYRDADGGYTDKYDCYTWPDGSFVDKNFNYIDKDGNLTTSAGDFYKKRDGVDFKAQLQEAAQKGVDWKPPKMQEGDVEAKWRKNKRENRERPDCAKNGRSQDPNETPRNNDPTTTAPTSSGNSALPPLGATNTGGGSYQPVSWSPQTNTPWKPKVDTAAYSSLLKTDLTLYNKATEGKLSSTNSSMFSYFRDAFTDDKSEVGTKFFTPLQLNSSSSPQVLLASSTTTTLDPKQPVSLLAPKLMMA